MITISAKKILIPIDFSDTSLRAIKQGVSIAKVFQSEIILLHVQKKSDLLEMILPGNGRDTLANSALLKEKLEKLAREIREKYNFKVTTLVSIGNITSEISEIALEWEADLIIMGTEGINSTNDFFMGSNSYRLITKSMVPVMTVRRALGKIGFSNILLPIDSSEHSRQKVNVAIKIADKFNARLYVLGILGKHEADYEYKLNVILPQIKKMAGKKHVFCSIEIDVATNRAEKTLEYAKKINAGLIITMSDEGSDLTNFILSTYAHQLINHSKVPVLSIPPETHPENLEEVVVGGMWQR